jgi:hypothetical protein
MKKYNLVIIGFLQASGLAAYCSLVAMLIWNGNHWFGKINDFRGPLLFLILFVTSALISALLALGYSVVLFWQKKEHIRAIKLIFYTAGFLILYSLLAICLLLKK